MNSEFSKSGCFPMILGLVFTCVGAFQLQEGVRLSMWGVPAKAVVERSRRESGGRFGGSSRRVTFQFEDASGKKWKGEDSVPLSRKIEKGEVLDVVYLPTKPMLSRIAGNTLLLNWGLCLAMGIAVTALGIWKLSKEQVDFD